MELFFHVKYLYIFLSFWYPRAALLKIQKKIRHLIYDVDKVNFNDVDLSFPKWHKYEKFTKGPYEKTHLGHVD